MTRRNLLQLLGFASVGSLLGARSVGAADAAEPGKAARTAWRDKVAPAAYRVLFEEDTERPQSSPLNDEKREGTYLCAACYSPLFSSGSKYESGTGWPSFFRPFDKAVATKTDYKIVLPRTEYHCARCGGHQGHRFDDGPAPTGMRYCNNGVALRFVPKGEPLPAVRD